MDRKIFIGFFVLFHIIASAQGIDDNILKQKIYYEVKQLSQFIDRFNYDEKILTPDKKILSRKQNLETLFDLKDSLLVRNPETIQFINCVYNDSNHVKLSFSEKDFFAAVNCKFLYHDKEKLLKIIMKPEGNSKSGYSWVICGAQGEILNLSKAKKNDTTFINPMNHEVGFSELSKALNNKINISTYTSSRFHNSTLSVFLNLIQSGDLKFKQIDSIEYIFLQIPNWIFTVQNFNRNSFNSGWLISSVLNMKDIEKEKFKKNICEY